MFIWGRERRGCGRGVGHLPDGGLLRETGGGYRLEIAQLWMEFSFQFQMLLYDLSFDLQTW